MALGPSHMGLSLLALHSDGAFPAAGPALSVLGPRAVTCTLWAAGVLGPRGVLAEQRRAHLRLTHHPPAVAGALSAGVYVPRFSFHKVLSSRGVANGGGAELRLLLHKVIWGRTQHPNTSRHLSAAIPTLGEPGAECSEEQRG